MKFSVIINNYNLGHFLGESVQSALAQTLPAHEIIIIDDGSTDNTRELVKKEYGGNPFVKIVAQLNMGQTAALAAGIGAATGEVLCFLDADDRLRPEYLKSIYTIYDTKPAIDVVFCNYEAFGETDRVNLPNPVWLAPEHDYDYGCTALLSILSKPKWIGNLTSTVSMKARLARVIGMDALSRISNFPKGADYGLLLGASVMGGRKYYLNKVLVDYRITDKNCVWLATRDQDPWWVCRRGVWHHAVADFFRKRAHLDENAYQLLNDELATIPNPLPAHRAAYAKLKRRLLWRHGKIGMLFSWLRELEWRFRSWRHREGSG